MTRNKKIITIAVVIIVVAGIGYWIYQTKLTEELVEIEQACVDSGGTVTVGMCCKATSDFPNLCLIGPCGCAPEHSHQVKICDCGEGKCFNGSECVAAK